MASLKTIISALQREITATLEENNALPAGARLQPGKVTLSLDVGFQESKTGTVEITCPRQSKSANGASESSGHKVTIEFSILSSAAGLEKPASRAEAQVVPATRIDAAAVVNVVQSLSSIFGAPGFDSSARAAVFRDALAELSEEQAQMVVRSFCGAPLPEQEQAKRARTMIVKILKTGPLKSAEEGAEILAALFEQHKLQAILNLIGREWKTQENWMR